ncbi:hypothetical protein PIB30_097587 [Stylosanthes scabra]|uniref:Uncharacterized protein n=1 Tax=Stylosanthes scabra TaxID=79078 RepID=A0ABU6SWZ4_9FABA|nr:hypothetical protein [Stylosanthes scabra]
MELAQEDPMLLELFDEIKDHWGFVWSHSHRVWIWGKFVSEYEVTSKNLSFTAPRVLVDSYTWEPIQEWIALRVDDRTFEIYAREIGREIYTDQAHPEEDAVNEDTVNKEAKGMDIDNNGMSKGDEVVMQPALTPASLGRM